MEQELIEVSFLQAFFQWLVIGKFQTDGLCLPAAVALVAELNIRERRRFAALLQLFKGFPKIAGEGVLGRHTVTENIHGKEVVVFLAEKSLEPGNLTGSSGKEHLPAGFEGFFYLTVVIANGAL